MQRFSAFNLLLDMNNNLKVLNSISSASKDAYNEFVGSREDGWICAETDWAQILEASFPHIHNRTLVLQDSRGVICGVLPLFLVKSMLTGNRLVSVPFATLSTPLLKDANSFGLFGAELKSLLQRTRSSYAEVRSIGEHSNISQFAPLIKKYICHFIDLQQPLEIIHRGLHRSIRRYLNQTDMKIRAAENVDDVSLFYRLYFYTRRRLFLPAMPKVFFDRLWKRLYPRGNISFLIVEIDNCPAASLMLLRYIKRVSAEAIGWDINYTGYRPTSLLYWEAIKRAHAEGYKIFDFGRTDPENEGLVRYKNRWGTEASFLSVYRYTEGGNDTKSITVRSIVPPSLQRILFGLPEPFYTALSRFSYRHLG